MESVGTVSKGIALDVRSGWVIAAIAFAIVVGSFLANARRPRMLLRSAARALLSLTAESEPPRHEVRRVVAGDDGYAVIDHGNGW